MAELVGRGVAALPALLYHLSDVRPTHPAIQGPDIGIVELGDAYDPRYSDPRQQPKGVNAIPPLDTSHSRMLTPPFSYVFRIGDLCYLAVGQIVNRNLGPVARSPDTPRMGHVTVVSSTLVQPNLAIATRYDWQGLTKTEHEASLRGDALAVSANGSPGIHAPGALYRLLFYYPNAGREIAEALLRRKLGSEINAYDERNLVIQLRLVDWPGLDALVFNVFQADISVPDDPVFSGARDDLALECARRLKGNGHDSEFRQFFSREIEANKAALDGGSRAYNYAHHQEIERFQEFVSMLQ
jgi:hypothetical protein